MGGSQKEIKRTDNDETTSTHHPGPGNHGGRPCIRGLRVTVGTVVGLVASGYSDADILRMYPYLEAEDIREALAYAAWRAEEIDVPIGQPSRS